MDNETQELKLKQRELKKDYCQLKKNKKMKEESITELEARMKNVQMLKFGQLVDLDLLDKVQTRPNNDDAKEQVRLQVSLPGIKGTRLGFYSVCIITRFSLGLRLMVVMCLALRTGPTENSLVPLFRLGQFTKA